jgi:hypothetical protein
MFRNVSFFSRTFFEKKKGSLQDPVSSDVGRSLKSIAAPQRDPNMSTSAVPDHVS